MKKSLLSVLLICCTTIAFAQQTTYSTQLSIKYYNDLANKSDQYINDRCVLDIYYPEKVKGFATIVWFHGGGLNKGNKEFPQALKDKGVCIVAVNYRLYPKVKAPGYIEDAAAAAAWVFRNIKNYGGDTTLIFVSGHSAGGYLSLMVGLDKKWLGKYEIDANRIAGLIPFSGQAITHFSIRKERGITETQPVIDDMAPLFHVRSDAPPLLLITGDREMELLGRYEENAYLARMMKVAGHKQTRLIELGGYGHNMAEPAFPLLLNEVHRIVDLRKNK